MTEREPVSQVLSTVAILGGGAATGAFLLGYFLRKKKAFSKSSKAN
jgi:hypothetical protein